MKATYDIVIQDHKRVDEALTKLSIEQSKVESMLDTFDKELSKVLDSRFGGHQPIAGLARDDVIKKFYGLIKTIKGYETEINKISEEIEQNITRNVSDDNKGLEAQLNLSVSSCYETIVALHARLIKIQNEISGLNAEEQLMY